MTTRLITLPGVFEPHSDSRLLADRVAAAVAPGDTVLDLCTGSGLLAISAAICGAAATAVDVSRRAVLTTRINARLNGVKVDARRGDLFAAIAGRRFDLIVSNPPYVPAPAAELPRRGPARATDAGHDGRVLLDRIIDGATAHLRPGGSLLLVHSSVCGETETVTRLAAAGLSPEIIERRRGPLGALLTQRRGLLAERGLLAPGAREEELLVFRAWRPAQTAAPQPATITPYRDGPYVISGSFSIRDQDGNEIDAGRRTIALCRCGRSKLRPFCDGTHKTIGFRAASAPEDPARR